MPNPTPNTTGITQNSKARTEQATKSVEQALRRLNRNKQPINVKSVAREAGVSTNFIYTHQELKEKVLKHRTTTRGVHLTTASEATDDNIVAALKHEIRNLKEQHKNEVAALKYELEEANKRIERLTAELITQQQ